MQLMGNVFNTDTTKQRKTNSSVPFTDFSPVSPPKGKKENKSFICETFQPVYYQNRTSELYTYR